MNEALFNPKFGYYTNQDPFGKKGDFVTSPEISQVFGELIAAYFINLWQNNYNSKEVILVEMGAGRGILMQDFLRFAAKIPNFLDKVDINIVEISPKLQKIQQQNLGGFDIKWHYNFSDLALQAGRKPIFFMANELLDCFAINQYTKTNGSWVQRLIGLGQNDELRFVLDSENPALDKIIKGFIGNAGKDGDIFEHSPALDNFISELFLTIKKSAGVAVLIDYGYIDNQLRSTLQSVKDHKYSNVFQDIGKSDITALVDFKRLEGFAKEHSLQSWLVTQKQFLESLGIELRRHKLLEGKSKPEQDLINSSINRLINKDQMGELFKVFICSYAK